MKTKIRLVALAVSLGIVVNAQAHIGKLVSPLTYSDPGYMRRAIDK
ncbi:hypothetical protein [Advenella sp. S44]|nr:hypothetical protein [Advenella sp. S44]